MKNHNGKNRGKQNIFFAKFSKVLLYKFLTIALLLLANTAFSQQTKRIYMIGNSLTDNIWYNGFKALAEAKGNTHICGRQMIPGAPIEWLWNHQDATFSEQPFGYPPNAFPNYVWDALTLQPFTHPLEADVPASTNYINAIKGHSPDVQVYMYANWPAKTWCTGNDFSTQWVRKYCNPFCWDNSQATADYYETCTRAVRTANPGVKPILMIPAGHVMYAMDQKMKAGQVPGYTNIFQVYNDDIHLGNVGAYMAGLTFFATIYKTDPRGMAVPSEYGSIPSNVATIIQNTVWEVVTNHALSGVTVGTVVPVTGLTVSPTSLTVNIAQTSKITTTVSPSNATDKSIIWSSSNTAIATVNNLGDVTGVAAGTATITARTNSGGFTKTVAVTVNNSITLRTADNPANAVAGIAYTYYEGTWSNIPDFNTLTPVKSGSATIIDLSARTRDDNFAAKFIGYVNVPSDGNYTFYTSSDDGSKLNIGTTEVVNNDGLHGNQEKSGSIGLKAGKHALSVTFFEAGGDQVLTVSYSGPSITKQTIPASALFQDKPNQAPTAVLNATPVSGSAPLTVSFNCTGSTDPDAGDYILGYDWDFGDGSPMEYSNAPTHIYTSAGTYTATLKVMDNRGMRSAMVTKTITVSGGTQPTVCGSISNPGFESDLTYWSNASNASISTSAKSGSKALVIGNAQGGLRYGSSIPASGGQTITFKGWGKIENESAWCGYGIDYMNASGVEIAEMVFQVNSSSYAENTKTETVPANTASINIWIYKGGTTGKMYLDDICLTLSGGSTNVPVTGVTVAPTSVSIEKGKTSQLSATVAPSNATDKSLIWTSSNTAVATVNATGLVSAVTVGTATITAKTNDGAKTATCAVTVTNAPAGSVYEAENASYTGGGIATDHTGYTGTGFWAYVNTQGSKITFTVNASTSGTYPVTCKYCAGSASARTMSLYVNGTKIRQVTFPATANWDTWGNKVDDVTLNSGNNTIMYQYDSGDNGGLNIDNISLGALKSTFSTKIENKDDYYIYPNPANDYIQIAFISNDKKDDCQIQVFNSLGMVIETNTIPAQSDDIFSLNTSNYNEGMYYLRIIKSNGESAIQKFLICK